MSFFSVFRKFIVVKVFVLFLVVFLRNTGFSQSLEFTRNSIDFNIKEGNIALVIVYDYVGTKFKVGKTRIPNIRQLESMFMDFLAKNEVFPQLVYTKSYAIQQDNENLKAAFEEKNIQYCISFYLSAQENIGQLTSGYGISITEVLFDESSEPSLLDIGLLPTVSISEIKPDGENTAAKQAIFFNLALPELLVKLSEELNKFEKPASTPSEPLIMRGNTIKIINGLPDDLSKKSIFIFEEDTVSIPINIEKKKKLRRALEQRRQVNQLILEKNNITRRDLAPYDFDFQYYSIKGIDTTNNTGYLLLYFDTFYELDQKLDDLLSVKDTLPKKLVLAQYRARRSDFQMPEGDTPETASPSYNKASSYRYCYLFDFVQNIAYVVDYKAPRKVRGMDIGENSSEYIIPYLDHISM